jgi:hypothetical protein
MKEIGGYFELELNPGNEYHSTAIKLNLGRCAFEYVLRAKKVLKVYLPYYTCDVMLEPITRTGVEFEFYNVDENMEPVFNYAALNENEYILVINYFGLKDKFINTLSKKVSNLIVDNSQAFFAKPVRGIDTFYSPRKFFGVPDGGYLYCDKILPENLDTDASSNRCGHLIGRIENGPEKFYNEFIVNDQKLCGEPLKQMSNLTRRLLQNVDYIRSAEIRKKNFLSLHENLSSRNEMGIDIQNDSVPMIYPFLCKKTGLREYLIHNKIFIARYWPNIIDWCGEGSLEYDFARLLVPLPIDQRYGSDEMKKIVFLVSNYCK